MRRIVTTSVAMLLALSLVACGATAPIASNSAADSVASSENQAVEVDKNLLTVEVTLPASMLESDEEDAESPEEYCARMKGEDGIKSATVNADGSVTLKMTKAKHQELLDGMKQSIDASIADYTNGETYASIKEITYNDDVTKFEVKVDSEAYANSLDGFVTLGLGFVGMYYDLMDGNSDPHITLSVLDATSGEEVSRSVFPDDYADLLNNDGAANDTEGTATN